MRVIEPHQFKGVKHPKVKRRPVKPWRILAILTLVTYLAVMLGRPIPLITSSAVALSPTRTSDVAILWPTYGQASVGAVGYGVLGNRGEQKPMPTASVAKVMTALAVLKAHPLKPGEQGPTIRITQEDVDDYVQTVAMGGSHVTVVLGQEISEYQALQALLLPSANNMANTLARWAFGSQEEYTRFVNNFAKSLGMTQSTFADASGFSPQTVSTTEDLAKLAVNAMDNPIIAEIAAQPSAVVPVAGTIYNVNNLLGENNIIGLKTGNTEEAGGCFMAAAAKEINGQRVIAVSVIMGAPDRYTALQNSVPLVNSVFEGFETKTIATAGQTIGEIAIPWQQSAQLVLRDDIKGLAWKSLEVKPVIELSDAREGMTANTEIGRVTARFGRDTVESPVVLKDTITTPDWKWRLMPQF